MSAASKQKPMAATAAPTIDGIIEDELAVRLVAEGIARPAPSGPTPVRDAIVDELRERLRPKSPSRIAASRKGGAR